MSLKQQVFGMPFEKNKYWELLVHVSPYDLSDYRSTSQTFLRLPGNGHNRYCVGPGSAVATGLFAKRLVSICKDAELGMWMFASISSLEMERSSKILFCNWRIRGREKCWLCLAKVIKLFSEPRIQAGDRFIDVTIFGETRHDFRKMYIQTEALGNILVSLNNREPGREELWHLGEENKD